LKQTFMSSRSISLIEKKSFTASVSPEAIHLLIVAAVGFAIVVPMMFRGVPSALDLSNHFRFALPFYDAVSTGNWHPGWLAESNGGFGDASFRFYPPALYYMLAAARAVSGNWYAATIATFGALSMIGALGMYLWACEFTSSPNAMWAGIFYAVAPYHINQFFQALMLAEFAGASVLPFAFLFVERVCRHRRAKDVAGLAASYALLVLTHLPLAVIGSIALALYALLRIDRQRVRRTLVALSISAVIGLLASASYWTTMVLELKWIRADNVNPEPGLDYRHNFVLSTFSPDSLNVWWINILLLSTVAMFWPAMILVTRAARQIRKSSNKEAFTTGAAALTVLLTMTVFMSTPLSRPIWNRVRFLQETQFPWRWLTITMMACSILLALSIPFWSRLAKTRRRFIAILALGTIVMSFAFSASHIVREASWLTRAQFEQTLSAIPGSPSVYQWLPVWVHEPLPEMNTNVEAGNRTIKIDSWTPERRVFQVTAGDVNEARIKTFFYPHWTATAGGRQLAVHADQSGALMVALPKEATEVTLEFREPARVRGAAGFTLLGWVSIGGLLVKRRSERIMKSEHDS
jgi:6-pyruvoyl-tetrahydropterin synthase related domain